MAEARKHAIYEKGSLCFYLDASDSWRLCNIVDVQGEGQSTTYCVEPLPPNADGALQPQSQVPLDRLAPMEEEWLKPVNDLLDMAMLHDSILLEHIRRRYWDDIVYTNIGPILLALNPFNYELPLYTEDNMPKYIAQQHTALDGGSKLPTHHWSVAHEAYWRMRMEKKPQSILVSGESGAGKTEGAKIVLKYLAKVSTFYAPPETKKQAGAVTAKIEGACPILEAFGNARTLRNENSSRFGKFMKLQFNKKGYLHGAHTTNYLLEKSRVVGHATGERSYHTFYQFLCGASEEERGLYGLNDVERFQWMHKGVPRNDRDIQHDTQEYANVRAAFQEVGFTEAEVTGIYTVVAGIMHLQCLQFLDQRGKAGLSEEDFNWLQFVCNLWGCNEDVMFAELTTTTTSVRGDTYTVEHTPAQASDIRDALSKALYERTFQYIVDRLNEMLDKEASTTAGSWIGLLDIFGFENFKDNYFEQLCINFCNEQLQQHYNKCVFQRDLAEYAQEGIDMVDVQPPNNQPTLDLISGNMGLFQLLDDQARNGSDEKFLASIYDKHGRNKCFMKPRIANNTFGVAHYAADVWYSPKGIREKNVDLLKPTLRILVRSSSVPFLAHLLGVDPEHDTPQKGSRGPTTVSKFFVLGLQQLMETIETTEPHWIRCVKPHHSNRPRSFCGSEVMNQLQCAGVLETIKIRQSGFAVRLPLADFWIRFRLLHCRQSQQELPMEIRKLLEDLQLTESEAQVGQTKVFLKAAAYKKLEQWRNTKLDQTATLIQRFALAQCALRCAHAHRLAVALVRVQQHAKAWASQYVRRVREKKWHDTKLFAALQLQRHARSKQSGALYFRLWVRARSTTIQSCARAYSSGLVLRQKQASALENMMQSILLTQRFMKGMQSSLVSKDKQQETVDWLSAELEILLELQRERQEAERKRKQALKDKVRASMGARAGDVSEVDLEAAASQAQNASKEIWDLKAQLHRLQQENTELQLRLAMQSGPEDAAESRQPSEVEGSHLQPEMTKPTEALEEMLQTQSAAYEEQLRQLREQLETSNAYQETLQQTVLNARFTVKRLEAQLAEKAQTEKRANQTDQRAVKLEKKVKTLEANVQKLEDTANLLRQLNARYQEEKAEEAKKTQTLQMMVDTLTVEVQNLRQQTVIQTVERVPFGHDGGALVRSSSAMRSGPGAMPQDHTVVGQQQTWQPPIRVQSPSNDSFSRLPVPVVTSPPRSLSPPGDMGALAFQRVSSSSRSPSQQGDAGAVAFQRVSSSSRSPSQQGDNTILVIQRSSGAVRSSSQQGDAGIAAFQRTPSHVRSSTPQAAGDGGASAFQRSSSAQRSTSQQGPPGDALPAFHRVASTQRSVSNSSQGPLVNLRSLDTTPTASSSRVHMPLYLPNQAASPVLSPVGAAAQPGSPWSGSGAKSPLNVYYGGQPGSNIQLNPEQKGPENVDISLATRTSMKYAPPSNPSAAWVGSHGTQRSPSPKLDVPVSVARGPPPSAAQLGPISVGPPGGPPGIMSPGSRGLVSPTYTGPITVGTAGIQPPSLYPPEGSQSPGAPMAATGMVFVVPGGQPGPQMGMQNLQSNPQAPLVTHVTSPPRQVNELPAPGQGLSFAPTLPAAMVGPSSGGQGGSSIRSGTPTGRSLYGNAPFPPGSTIQPVSQVPANVAQFWTSPLDESGLAAGAQRGPHVLLSPTAKGRASPSQRWPQ